jgi:putative transposase
MHRRVVARALRDKAGGVFHIYTHCVWAAPALFRDDTDRASFLRELARATTSYGWTCIAFCLMRSHYHLILEVDDGVLPVGMQSLNFRHAVYFNQRHGMRGHVQFQRYGSKRIRGESHLLTVFRYVARNPDEAQLCSSPADWVYSSYAGTVGLAEPASFVDPGLVLACFDGSLDEARAQLRAFVEGS